MVFIPLILLVSIGFLTFSDRRVRAAVLTVAVVAGLVSSIANVTTNRTQAGQVARAIAHYGRPGDIVVTAGVQALHPGQKIRLLGTAR